MLAVCGATFCVGAGGASASAQAVRFRWPTLHGTFNHAYTRALRNRATHPRRNAHGWRRSTNARVSIAGGSQIGIAQAPWQVEIFAELPSKKSIACGGAILDSTHVLTAAHCTYDPETSARLAASSFVLVAGIAPMTAEEIKNNSATQARFIASVRVHPSFQYSLGAGASDDVAVLQLAKPLSFDATVQPIALPPVGESLVEGAGLTLTGFGEQQQGVEANHNLYSLSMATGFSGKCGGEVDAVFVCASSQAGSGCSGDSGGALTSGPPATVIGVMDTVEVVSGQACKAGATNGFVNTSAPEIKDFIEGSEAPPLAPRGGKGVAFEGEGKEGEQAKIGVPLTCEPGSWSGSPTITYAFVDSANGIVLQSGASSTYTPTSDDVGRAIYCEVQASNAGGTGVARTVTARAVYDPTSNEEPSAPTVSGMQWSPVAAMSEPRARQTATLLGDGEVLIAGGHDASDSNLASAQLFNPVTGTWRQAAPMLVGRSGHLASLLSDGDVLVVGGWETPKLGEYVRTAELYDPATNAWTAAPVPAELEESQSLTTLPDGMVLLRGVFGTELFDQTAGAAIYDPSSNSWTRVASPKLLRYGATATLLPDGDVLVIGGSHSEPAPFPVDHTYTLLGSVEEFDPATNTWRSLASMGHGRTNEAATLMANGEVFVAGGTYEVGSFVQNTEWDSLRYTESYDPATNRWTARAPALLHRAQDTATLMENGEVLVAGGYDCGGNACLGYGGSGDCCGASSVEVYDPSSNTWQYTDPVLSGTGHTATLLPGRGVLVTGGELGPTSGYEALSSAEIFAPASGSTTSPPAKTTALAQPSITGLVETHKRWREGKAIARISARFARANHGWARKRAARRTRKAPLGTAFRFTLNEQATVTLTFIEQLPGRKVKGKCLAPSHKDRRARPCKRGVVRGKLTFTGHAGENTVRFQGRVSRAVKLPPGRYTVLVTAVNAAKQSGKAARLSFTIVR